MPFTRHILLLNAGLMDGSAPLHRSKLSAETCFSHMLPVVVMTTHPRDEAVTNEMPAK